MLLCIFFVLSLTAAKADVMAQLCPILQLKGCHVWLASVGPNRVSEPQAE